MTDYSKEKNELKVELENFQSISNASLDFVQGINIIVGQSNSGKSAILRAIKGAILNPSGSQKYIKNGTKTFKVALDYNGNKIEWSRDKKSPKYVINGEEYLKVGNSNLCNMLDNSGFVLDEGNNLMNIESELELPFPFDKNNSELFKLFEKNIFCVSDSATIAKLIKADEDEVNKNKDNTEYELDRVKSKLQAIIELEDEVDLNKLIKGRNQLSNLMENSRVLTLDINNLCDKMKLGKALSKAISQVEVSNLQQDYILLLADIKKLNEIRGVGSVLKALPTASTPVVDAKSYIDLNTDIMKLLQAHELISILRALEAPRSQVINDEYTSLRNDINTLSRLCKTAQNLKKDMMDNKTRIQELANKKSQFKVCPLCGGELND